MENTDDLQMEWASLSTKLLRILWDFVKYSETLNLKIHEEKP
jgi:hypothetical protein